MTQFLSGPGVGLPPPQSLYPSELLNAPNDVPTNYIGLAPGESQVIPAGQWAIEMGPVAVLQFLDPVTGIWRGFASAREPMTYVRSDGFSRRVANLTACPIAAVVAGGGTGFAQSTAAITANVGGSLWQAVVGGSLSVSTISAAGAGYSLAPTVLISAPPTPGVQATAIATITAGTVSAVSLTNVGAGYVSAPKAVIVPAPSDPNYGGITQASVTLVLNAATAGAITAALCTNNGAPLATLSALTLTAAGGAGAGATITPLILQSITSATVTAGGGGFGTAASPPLISTAQGVPTAVSAIGNPSLELTGFRPRAAIINVTSSSLGAISAPVVTDPGLFLGTPTPVIMTGGTIPTTLAGVTLATGGVNDSILMQPL